MKEKKILQKIITIQLLKSSLKFRKKFGRLPMKRDVDRFIEFIRELDRVDELKRFIENDELAPIVIKNFIKVYL